MKFLRGSTQTFFAVLGIFTAIVCLFIGIVYWSGRAYARVSLPQEYWLLVRDCEEETAAAVLVNSYLSGGAGYLIETGTESYVVLACYDSEHAAKSVQTSLNGKGIETRIVNAAPADFVLGGGAVAQRELILANAETVDTCAKILYDTANSLERTEISQAEARAAVRGVVGSLKGLREQNTASCFGLWNTVLSGGERRGTELANGILFAKDLRYLQIQLSISVVNMGDYF